MHKRVIRPNWYVGPKIVFSPAVVFNRWVFVSGQLASDFEFGLTPEARSDPNLPLHGGDQVSSKTVRGAKQVERFRHSPGILLRLK